MTGKQYLDFLIGTTSATGMLDKNVADTEYRAFMLGCLNLVLNDIQARQENWHWRWLETTSTAPTVADQMDYDMPTDIDEYKIFSVFDRTNNVTYRYKEHDEFLRLVPNPSLDTGNPYWYTVWAKNLKLYPVPSSVFTFYIKYIKNLTPLTDEASSTTEVPSKYDNVIIDGALKWAYKFDPTLGNETTQTQIYELGISKMMSENGSNINNLSVTRSHRSRNDRERQFPVNQ